MGILRKLFPKKEASGAPVARPPGLTCAVCARDIPDYHYSFESIMTTQVLGWQCPDCGRVFCHDHAVEQEGGTLCPECGAKLYGLEEGPAYASMVEASQRNGRYNAFIHAPDAQRVVKKG